jgi:arsenical pump membrane protein
MNHNLVSWLIAACATAGVITRPFKWPEAVWAVGGATLIVLLGLLPLHDALAALGKGTDVYLFLTGMMVLSELARREGLFDWVAVLTVNHARASPKRLFLLVYIVGTVVTTFLSNDATAVVLTPAVFAAAKKAEARALPLLFVCAFVANAASFVLPISNPANLVLYSNRMPALGYWLARFALPSLFSIAATYAALRWTQRGNLDGACKKDLQRDPLSTNGRLALAGLGITTISLLVVSMFDMSLGLPTAILATLIASILLIRRRTSPWPLLKDISWSVLPLVAGLFVLVETLNRTGVIDMLAAALNGAAKHAKIFTAAIAGVTIAVSSNALNNLPAGLIASATVALANSPQRVIDALLIGVDLGPNLSITGSLATILWLKAIRREGEDVSFWTFLKVGACVMPPALLLAIAMRMLIT